MYTAGEGIPVLIAIALDPVAENVTEARHRIARVLTRDDVEPEHCQRVVLALSELVTNAVLHGSRNPIQIEVSLDGETIELLVAQEADGTTMPAVEASGLADRRNQIGGRGLAIVAAIAESVAVHVDEQRVEFRARFSPRTDEPTTPQQHK